MKNIIEILKSDLKPKAKIAYILLHLQYNNKETPREFLRREMKEGDFAVRRILNELEKNNFIKRVGVRNKKTKKFSGVKLIFLHSCETEIENINQSENEIIERDKNYYEQ